MFFSQKRILESWLEERRLEARVDIPDLLTLKLKKKGLFQPSLEAKSRDLSNHGIRFVTAKNFKKGQQLHLEWDFPSAFQGEQRMKCQCRVINVQKSKEDGQYRICARFIELSPLQEETLKQFVWLYELEPSTFRKAA